MSPEPLRSVETPGPISLRQTLLRLHAMVGREVKVEINDYGYFFGAGFEGVLLSVETMESETAIRAVISRGAGFFLDFDCIEALVVDGGPEVGSWLEFRRDHGPAVSLQLVDHSASQARQPR